MTEPRCPVFLTIAVLGLLLTIPALGQSYTTVPGNTLVSMMGVTDPNAVNEAWQTALMAAASNFDEKRVKDLMERKADVNAASRVGVTALMYAKGLCGGWNCLLGAGGRCRFTTKTTQEVTPCIMPLRELTQG